MPRVSHQSAWRAGEHLAEDVAGVGQRLRAEDRVAGENQRHSEHQAQRIEPCSNARREREAFGKRALDRQQHALMRAPQYEVPIGAVPESAQRHGQHQVAVSLHRAATAAAQRNVEIVAQPLRQCEMPAAPVFGDAGGQIWTAKVLREMEPQQQRHADGHVRIPGEIEEHLYAESHRAAPGRQHPRLRGDVLEVGV